jgi:Na+/pantothenate symporter
MGLVGPSVLPGLDEREQIVPSLAEKFLPTFFLMMLAGAAISASLSTVVSVLLSRGSIITYNVLVPTRPNLSEAVRVRFARGSAIALGLMVLAIVAMAHIGAGFVARRQA